MEVTGDSMWPTLEAGDRLVVLPPGRPEVGQLVVVSDPRQPSRRMVKRVVAVDAGGALEVEGDNRALSTDSRHLGPLARAQVLGRVVYRYAPEHRRGRLDAPLPADGRPRRGERR